MSSPTFPVSGGGGGGGEGTSDHSLLTNRDAADQHPVASITGAASKTVTDTTLYVYEDATGQEDGSSKANGYTELQDAIDAISDFSQNVTIIASKGSTNYLGKTFAIPTSLVKSLTIQGEYYYNANCDSNAVAGKIVDADGVFTGLEAGDRVVCTKYSGTLGSSSIEDYFYATITEIGSGYVQTSESTKIPTTGWTYLINQTVFDGNNSTDPLNYTTRGIIFALNGISCVNYAGSVLSEYNNTSCSLTYCIFNDCKSGLYGDLLANSYFAFCSFTNPKSGGYLANSNSSIKVVNTLISGATSGIVNANGTCIVNNSGFFGVSKAIWNQTPTSLSELTSCYIASSCTNGAYGYNITLISCTNLATTPVTNLVSGGAIDADNAIMLYKTGATYDSVQDWANAIQSSGRISGGVITAHSPANGTVDISALKGFIKYADTEIAETRFFDLAAATSVALTDDSANYIYVDYNAGTPQILVTTDRTTIKTTNQFTLGRAFRKGTAVEILNSGINLYNRTRKIHEKWIDTFGGVSYANGILTTATGLKPAISAGTLYAGSNKISIAAVDCNASGTFTSYYYNPTTSSWVITTGQTSIDATYYNKTDTGTGLAELTANRYGIHWLYVCPDGNLYVMYGKGDYTLTQAQEMSAPTSPIPNYISQWAKLAAKIIVQKAATSLYSITIAWSTQFPVQTPGDHNALAGLQGGTPGEYYHLTASQSSDLGSSWSLISSGYTATPASTSTLTMTSDLTATIKAGYGVKYTIGGTVYYGVITAMASNLMTIAGAPLSGDVSSLNYTKTGVVQMPILIPGYYEDASNTGLIASDLGQAILWQQGPAYCVRSGFKTRVADSSSDGKVQAYIAGDILSTSNTNTGLVLANANWTYTVVDINTTNYSIAFGEAIEIGATKGTGGTAIDLSVLLTFVVA